MDSGAIGARPPSPVATGSADPALAGRGPGTDTADGGRSFDPGPLWARILPPVAALAVSLWGITTPSFWRDEAATISAVQRPFGQMFYMLGHVDAVHGLYYSMMWPLVHLFGPGELVLRLPSAIAAAIAAAALAAIGRRLISPWAGLAAGLVLVVLPVTSRYAQEGRSYEMEVALATIASYLIVRLLQSRPGGYRRWLIWYGVVMAVLGVMNIFGLLLLGAHAITLAVYLVRRRADPVSRRLAAGWLAAGVAAVVVASPLLVYGWKERGQIAWLAVNKSSTGPETLITLPGSITVTAAVLLLIGIALVASLALSGERRRATWPWQLAALSLPWLIFPPALLFAASVVKPIYTSRYILMCIPALALIAGAAVAALGRYAGPVGVAVVLVAGLPTQITARMPYGHYDNIRALDRIVAAHRRPGDVVLYTNPNAETFPAAYSYGLRSLPNIQLKQAPIPSGTLGGTNVSLPVLRSRLRHVSRLWIVEINKLDRQPEVLGLNGLPVGYAVRGLPLRLVRIWHERGDWLLLYTRA